MERTVLKALGNMLHVSQRLFCSDHGVLGSVRVTDQELNILEGKR